MNDFDRTEVEALKQSVDLVDVVRGAGLELRQVGQNLMACCPFHEDDRASLSVNPEAQLWNCFGCQAGGDVLSFLQLHGSLTFPRALEELRQLARQAPARERPARKTPQALPGGHSRAALLGRVAELYARSLLETPRAQQYLANRGLGSRELWEAFGVGYADGSLLETVPADGDLRQALVDVGVLTAKGKELMQGCVVVPLGHPDHGVVGLYGRKIHHRASVHHLYLPGPKRGALNWQTLKASPEVLITESVLDALSLWAAGVREVSCLYGVHGLPADLVELMGRFATRRVRLCLDGDGPGQEATVRLGAQLAERGIRCFSLRLPEGSDPNTLLVDQGPQELFSLVTEGAWEPLEPPATEPELEKSRTERTGDGFVMRFGEVFYRVTPRPPFSGRLRVTVKVEREGSRPYIDTLDLYSHRARASAVNQVSRRLSVPRPEVEVQFLAVVEEAERWVGEFGEETGEDPEHSQPKAPVLTAADQEEALAFLRQPDLAQAILSDMNELGYVGEERGKLLGYLIGVSRMLESPLSGIVISQSGAGKSGLAEIVEQLTPEESVVHYSRITAQALGYYPRDFLKRKLVILEERVGGEAADYHIRILQSRHKLSQAVVIKDPNTGRMRTQHFEVEGPIAYLETTTNPNLNHENATRCFEIHLDETEDQTQRIHQRQREARTLERYRTCTNQDAIRNRHKNAQRLLARVKVVIPYVHLLSFPSRWLRTRRDHERFLCLIEASAFLHQAQRPRGELEGPGGERLPYIEASADDYRLAYELARDVLRSSLHELSRAGRELWGAAQELVSGGNCDGSFTRRELRVFTGWPDRRLREALEELVDMEYLEVVGGASQGRTYHYVLAPDVGQDGPSPVSQLLAPEELERRLKASPQL